MPRTGRAELRSCLESGALAVHDEIVTGPDAGPWAGCRWWRPREHLTTCGVTCHEDHALAECGRCALPAAPE